MSKPATKDDVREIVREAIEEFASIVKVGFDDSDRKITEVKGGLQELREYVENAEKRLEQQVVKTHEQIEETQKQIKDTREKIEDSARETREHFEAIAENIHKDVAGANQAEIDLLQHKQEDHEGRIVRLEEKTGVL